MKVEDRHKLGVERAMRGFAAKAHLKKKVCECGMEFVEKKDYYRHKNKCKPKPLPPPRQLNLFGGR